MILSTKIANSKTEIAPNADGKHFKVNLLPIECKTSSLLLFEYKVQVHANDMLITDPYFTSKIVWSVVQNRESVFPTPEEIIFDDSSTLWSRNNLFASQNMMFLQRNHGTNFKIMLSFNELVEIDSNPQKMRNREKSAKMLLLIATQSIRNNFDRYRIHYENSDRSRMIIAAQHFGSNEPNKFQDPEEATIIWRGISITSEAALQMGMALSIDVVANTYIKPNISLSHILIQSVFGALASRNFNTFYQQLRLTPRKLWQTRFDGFMKGKYVILVGELEKRVMLYRRMCQSTPTEYEIEIKKGTVSLSAHYDYQSYPLKYTDLPLVEVVTLDGDEYVVPMEMLKTPDFHQLTDIILTGADLEEVEAKTHHLTSTRFAVLEEILQSEKLKNIPVFHPDDKWAMRFGVVVKTQFAIINGKSLAPPRLISKLASYLPEDQSNVKKLGSPTLLIPSVIFIQDPEDTPKRYVEMKLGILKRVLSAVKLHQQSILEDLDGTPMISTFQTFHPSKSVELLRVLLEGAKEMANSEMVFDKSGKSPIPMIFFIFAKSFNTSSFEQVLGLLTYICQKEIGMHTQIIMEEDYDKIEATTRCPIAQDIVTKVLAKLGTLCNSTIGDYSDPNWKTFTCKSSPTLVLGISTLHSTRSEVSKNDTKSLSFIAVVGNTDFKISKFGENVTPQKRSSNSIAGLVECVTSRLDQFMSYCKVWPKHIVVLRSEKKDDDRSNMMDFEIKAIRFACQSFSINFEPTITYIFANRNHSFYSMLSEQETSGLVAHCINEEICSRSLPNFYMNTDLGNYDHKPTHYIVAVDEWKRCTELWQRICHRLCQSSLTKDRMFELPTVLKLAELSCRRGRLMVQ